MERTNLISTLGRFKSVLNESTINEIGKKLGFCERKRTATPYRMVLSIVSALSCMRVESLADLHRGFAALFENEEIAYKPFHNQLSKKEFPRLMREIASVLLTKFVVKALKVKRGSRLSEFKEIVIQDGTSFAVKDDLSSVFPGRFTKGSPAAVELHVTMNLLEGSVQRVTLTPDTEEERGHLPEPSELSKKLLLADRGYFSLEYIDELIDQDRASFIIRASNAVNPLMLKALTADGKDLKNLEGKKLKTVGLSKDNPTDIDAEWRKPDGCPVDCRLICSWNSKTKTFNFFATNLPRELYPASDILSAYRLRWQIELLFKEWKSYANLHAFDTSKAAIAEGLIWASLAAATIKRFLAHVTQAFSRVEISTRKVAMCAIHVLLETFQALAHKSNARLYRAWKHAIDYLSHHAMRSHPARDRSPKSFASQLKPAFQ